MKKSNLITNLVASILCLCTFSNTLWSQEKNTNTIQFIQGDSTYTITKSSDIVYLKKNQFSIRYFSKPYDSDKSKFYAMRVAALTDAKDTIVLKNEKKTENISYFEPGTGIAPGENEMYDIIYFSQHAHHYLMFENQKDKRAYFISKYNDLVELEWRIFGVNFKDKEMKFTDFKKSAFYLVFFYDKNLNDKIDKEELKIVTIKFLD